MDSNVKTEAKMPKVESKSIMDTPSKAEIDFKLQNRKIKFNDDVQVLEYDVISDNEDSNEILCPESPETSPNGSPLLCLETIFDDRHSDSLFDSNTESENEDEIDIVRGRRAKKTFKVKFGDIPN